MTRKKTNATGKIHCLNIADPQGLICNVPIEANVRKTRIAAETTCGECLRLMHPEARRLAFAKETP